MDGASVMSGSRPQAVGAPSPHVLCNECARRLFVIHRYGGRWTLCVACDTGWMSRPELDVRVQVGPPIIIRAMKKGE